MAFFNPGVLFFLPLAALPILIHLIGRRRVQSVEFSTLRFLQSLENQVMRRLKLKQIFLLILRTLLIVVLIMSLARPYRLQEGPQLLVRRGETLFLLLDNSASMQLNYRGATLFNYALDRVKQTANEIEFPIELVIVQLAGQDFPFREIYAENKEQLATELDRQAPGWMAAQPQKALELVLAQIREKQLFNASIWMVSDFQASNWSNFKSWLAAAWPALSDWHPRLIMLPVQAERDNLAINEVSLPDQVVTREEPVTLTCQLTNWNSEAREVPLSLFLEQERIGQHLVQITAHSQSTVPFNLVLLKSGPLSGLIEAADDFLQSDNRFYFILNSPPALKVLLIEQKPNDSQFITTALEAAGADRIAYKTISAKQIFGIDLREWDLLILVNVDHFPGELNPRLQDYFSRGGRLLLFLGDDCQIENYNRYWAKLWQFPTWHQTVAAREGAYLALGSYRKNHAIFRDVWRQAPERLDEVHFYQIPEMVLQSEHQPLLFYSNQTPLLIETAQGILAATAPNASWSDWQYHGSFPMMVLRLVQYLVRQPGSLYYSVGDTLTIDIVGGQTAADYNVMTPQGRRIKLEYDKIRRRYIFKETVVPGFYTVFRGAQLDRKFAVNLSLSETTGQFWEARDFRELAALNSRQIGFILPEEQTSSPAFVFGKEYEKLLLILALLLIFGETLLGIPKRSKVT